MSFPAKRVRDDTDDECDDMPSKPNRTTTQREAKEKRVREDTPDAAEDGDHSVVQTVLRGMKKVRKGLNSPGQSLGLIHAGVSSVLGMLTMIHSRSISEDSLRLSENDPRLCYIRALAKGESLLKSTGFQKDKANRLWVFQIQAMEMLPVIVECLHDVLFNLVNEIAQVDKSQDPTVDLKDVALFPDAKTQILGAKIVGCTLGGILGDVLGAPVSTWESAVIRKWFHTIYEVHALPPSDQTNEMSWCTMTFQQMLGVYSAEVALQLQLARSLLQSKSFKANEYINKAAKHLKSERPRPMLHTARALLKSFVETGRQHPSSLSGVTMGPGIVTPLAIVMRHAPESSILANIKVVLQPFAQHPDAIGTSFLHCLAIQCLLKFESSIETFQPSQLLDVLLTRMEQHRLSDSLTEGLRQLQQHPTAEYCESPTSQSPCDVVPLYLRALAIFQKHCMNPVQAMIVAVNGGHGGSSVGLIVGTLLGALHGYQWVPSSWYGAMCGDEDANKGTEGSKDEIVKLACRLSEFTIEQ